jgi:hypothetical protein
MIGIEPSGFKTDLPTAQAKTSPRPLKSLLTGRISAKIFEDGVLAHLEGLPLYADGTQKTELSGDGNRLDPIPAAEFLHHIIEMKAYRRFGNSGHLCDL